MIYSCLNSLALKVDTFCQAGIHFWLETMKDIKGFEGVYAITKEGKVWVYPREESQRWMGGSFLKNYRMNTGYFCVRLFSKGKEKLCTVHRLVALYYIPNPENKGFVNHKNGIKTDNRIGNLEWCTQAENNRHASITGLCASGESLPQHKLTKIEVLEIRKTYRYGDKKFGGPALGRKHGVHQGTISQIITRKIWKQI